MPLEILFAGNYEPDYNRTAILRAGLLKLGHRVREYPFKGKSSAAGRELRALAGAADFVFMPSFTHKEVSFVKKNSRGKKVVFDPLISRYMTKALDYANVWKYGLAALRARLSDRSSMAAADFVVTDTAAHLEWFHSNCGVPREKMGVLYIGNDFGSFFPGERPAGDGRFVAGFYGSLNPLQGVVKILEAARLLRAREDILFRIVGDGFDYARARAYAAEKRLPNVDFAGRVPQSGLREKILGFDAALGIFGDTLKAGLVIPNKVYHYAACRRPIITRDTPAIRELFAGGEDMVLTDGSPESLAEAVLRLKDDPALAARLAASAHDKIRTGYDEVQVAEKLLSFRGRC
ncbi:MAG TPA: glycosyltransferase [Elusimicrobiales bacterium]|nr:glycosyltransferase [Elusimicrobiales bacterium]